MLKKLTRFGSMALVALACAHAPSANAIPLYFEGPGGWGFSVDDLGGMSIMTVDASASWQTAGTASMSPLLEVSTVLLGVVGVQPPIPSFATPLLANVQYTVTNTTGATLDDEYLVFTLGAVEDWPFIEPHEFGLDPTGLTILASNGYFFGAVLLPEMAPGAIHTFQLVHVVADQLGGTVVPSPGLALLVNHAVPEPAPLALLACAAVGLFRRRGR